MAQGRIIGNPAAPGVWFDSGEDHGKPVRYRIRPISNERNLRIHRQVYGDRRVRQIGNESISNSLEKLQEFHFLRAIEALEDTENFSVDIVDAEAAERYSKLLGQALKPGDEPFIDGHWTDDLRSDVLSRLRKRAAWISKKADALTEADIEAEEEEAEGF